MDDNHQLLAEGPLREKIYEEVVHRLESELIQGFPEVSLDRIDQMAEGMDFASWDRAIRSPKVDLAPSEAASPRPVTAYTRLQFFDDEKAPEDRTSKA